MRRLGRQKAWRALLTFAGISFVLGACTPGSPSATSDPRVSTEAPAISLPTTQTTATTAPPVGEVVELSVFADAADCRGPDEDVADLAISLPGKIVIVGDLAYPDGSTEAFRDCFLPLYGGVLDRIHSVPGDNDYEAAGAAPYFAAVGEGAGTAGQGWWAFDYGEWQIIGLNAQCKEVQWCGPQSPQYKFLEDALVSRPDTCRVAVWHQPRFTSSANYRGIAALGDLYTLLYEHGTDVLLVGNSHHYERFAPLDPNGNPDPQGIANITVGIGGAPYTQFGDPLPGSEVRNNESRGVLRLSLAPDSYSWNFLPADNRATLSDSGTLACHNAAS